MAENNEDIKTAEKDSKTPVRKPWPTGQIGGRDAFSSGPHGRVDNNKLAQIS